jgi:hypothetical protein
MPKSFGSYVWTALVFLGLAALPACSQFGDPQPAQPLQFEHKIHAVDNKIPCQYCHQMADKTAAATVPPMGTCMNCHKFIPGTKNPKVVTELRDAWEAKKQIEWAKVHDLPDFVYFPHKWHVRYFTGCAEKAFADGKFDALDQDCALNPNQKFAAMSKPISEPVSVANVEVMAQYFTCSQCHGPVWEFTSGKRVEPLNMGWCVTCHKNRVAKAPAEQQEVLHARMLDCWTCHK